VRESGFGREGGWEGLLAYTKPDRAAQPLETIEPFTGEGGGTGIDRTTKLYISGKQARPDGGYSQPVFGADGALLGHVSLANRKDVRNAVEAAEAAASWSATSGHLRAQILYFIAENLSARADEFAARLDASAGTGRGADEVQTAIQRLFTYAAWADKFDGNIKGVPIRGVACAKREPVGVIGALCPAELPLLGLVSVLGPAMAMGNRSVLCVSEPYPLAAMEFLQVLETSDVPGGVVNLLSGPHAATAPTLVAHLGVDAVWSFGAAEFSEQIERAAAGNLKRTWVNNGLARDWMGRDGEGREFLEASTEIKTIWIPYGA
jgi:aldehyde dehydrogenase (NAD+)